MSSNSFNSEGVRSEGVPENIIDRLKRKLIEKPPIPEDVQNRINFLTENAPDKRMKGVFEKLSDRLDILIKESESMVYKKGPDNKNIPDDEAIRKKLIAYYYPQKS